MDIQNMISLSAVILYIIPFIAYIITNNIVHIKAIIGLFATMGVGESIKYYLIKDASPRPKGAHDCNLWCNDGPQGGNPGMPSGHSAQVAFFSSFYYRKTTNIWVRAGLLNDYYYYYYYCSSIFVALVLYHHHLHYCY